MNNLLPSAVTLHEKYDLKGSTYKRRVRNKKIHFDREEFNILIFRRRNKNDRKSLLRTRIWILWSAMLAVF